METSNSTNNNGSVLNLNERQTQLILRLKKYDGIVLSRHIEWLDIAMSLLSETVIDSLVENYHIDEDFQLRPNDSKTVAVIANLKELKEDLDILLSNEDYN